MAAHDTDLGDAELVAACKAGDHRSWRVFVDRFSRLVYTVAVRAGLQENDAEDAFQRTFEIAFRRLDSLSDPQAVSKWLIVIAQREAIRLGRKAAATHSLPLQESDIELDRAGDSTLREHKVHAALERLEARMDAGNDQAQAKATYEHRLRGNRIMQKFKVEVEDWKPNAEPNVYVNGMLVGAIKINRLGFGKLQLRTASFIDGPGDGTPIGGSFPRLQPGDTVTVGDLEGVFQNR